MLDTQGFTAVQPETDDAKGELINALQAHNAELKLKILHERFMFTFGLFMVADVFIFSAMQDGLSSIALLIPQLVFLFILAEKCEVKAVELIFRRIVGAFGGS